MAGGAHSGDDELIANINVTPLVDISLVLLIIFMVTARIIDNQGMPMDLPKAASGEAVQTVFSLELTLDGKTWIDSKEVDGDETAISLAKLAKQRNPEVRAVIRADQKVEHGRVVHALDLLRRSGLSKIAIGSAPDPEAAKK